MTDLERDLAALLARHPEVGGRQFVEACLLIAEAYFPPDDLPILASVGLLLEPVRH